MSVDKLGELLQGDAAGILNSDERCLELAAESEAIARYAAQHLGERYDLVESLSTAGPVWPRLAGLWDAIGRSFQPGSEAAGSLEDSRISLALGLAKLERNLIAGLAEHQDSASEHEEHIRLLIFNLTTFGRIEDERFYTLQAVITQLLVNLVSPISAADATVIADQKLLAYLSGVREDDIVIRLLDSRVAKVNMATLHLINNLTRESTRRQEKCLNEHGVRWFSKILDRLDDWHTLEDGRFELAVQIFTSFIYSGLHPTVLSLLGDEAEPITPAQTIFLRLVDSHIASPSRSNAAPSPHIFLVDRYRDYSRYASISLRSGQDDARLPKVFEALVLVCESLCSIGLASQARRDKGKGRADMEGEKVGGDEEVVGAMKQPDGVIRPAVDLLGGLDKLIPRVKPGTQPTHRLSPDQAAPIASLKRLLVQLLGILTFDDNAAGDLVRECGGVHLILGLTEVDEMNPYLREHALFTVRNLMLNNPANQAIIGEMDPVGVLSETGEVLPVPDKMKRKQQPAATVSDLS